MYDQNGPVRRPALGVMIDASGNDVSEAAQRRIPPRAILPSSFRGDLPRCDHCHGQIGIDGFCRCWEASVRRINPDQDEPGPVDTGGKLPELDTLGTIRECKERLDELRSERAALGIITGMFFGMIAFATAYVAWKIILS